MTRDHWGCTLSRRNLFRVRLFLARASYIRVASRCIQLKRLFSVLMYLGCRMEYWDFCSSAFRIDRCIDGRCKFAKLRRSVIARTLEMWVIENAPCCDSLPCFPPVFLRFSSANHTSQIYVVTFTSFWKGDSHVASCCALCSILIRQR